MQDPKKIASDLPNRDMYRNDRDMDKNNTDIF